MPWNPATGMFEVARPAAAGRGFGGTKATNVHGTSAQSQGLRYMTGSLLPAERGTEARAGGLADRYDQALGDFGGTVDKFGEYYQKAGAAIAAPAQRDFNQTLARTGANVASRFGGNASGEEVRQGYNTSDLFSRNLGEALARLAPQQIESALGYTGQLGGAAAQSAEERDRLRALILQQISGAGARKEKAGFGDYVGAALGGAASAFL